MKGSAQGIRKRMLRARPSSAGDTAHLMPLSLLGIRIVVKAEAMKLKTSSTRQEFDTKRHNLPAPTSDSVLNSYSVSWA